jgi:TonB family protein
LSPDAGASTVSEGVYEEIVKPVLVTGSRTPKYPEILRQAGVEGEVLVSFDVDEAGQPDVATLKVIRSTHELFAIAVREALPGMRFRPAQHDGRRVRLTVQEPFLFTLPGTKSAQERRIEPKDAMQETVVKEVPLYRSFTLRPDQSAGSKILLRGAGSRTLDGSPLLIIDGVIMKGEMSEIDPQVIESIEVVKGAAAMKTYGPRAEHGVVQITTKARKRVP